jgi:ferredoxin
MSAENVKKFISFDALPGFLAGIAEHNTVYAPRREGGSVVYRPLKPGDAPELGARPTESCKHVVFPRSEELFAFAREADKEQPGVQRLVLTEPPEPGPSVVFGALSCDARGFLAFDPVYAGSGTGGSAKDTYYLRRRSRTLLVVKACKSVLNTCFCNWVGGGPASPQGADVVAVEAEQGLVLDILSEQGAAFAESLPAASAGQIGAAAAAVKTVEDALPKAADLSAAPGALAALFSSAEFWKNESAQCLYCGACTYLCPTCYCFNITDESDGLSGTRLRSWDNCMSPLFTLEASGHNPRPNKADRLKNRVGHKFSYYPSLHAGRFSCCGCGRCIKSCPSSVDIRKIVLDAVKEAANV